MTVSKLTITRSRLRLAVVPAVAAAALLLAGCTPAGGNTTSPSDAASGAPAVGAGKTNIVVIGGASDDSFFSSVKRGIDDATKVVESHGGKVSYLALANYNNLGPDVAKLIDTAAGQKPDAIAVPDWVPDSEDPSLQKAVAAGIKVFIYNAGGEEAAKKVGAVSYIGTDEYLAGVAGGEALGKAGAKKTVCVNTVPGAQNLEDRCRGVKDGLAKTGGTTTQLNLAGSNFGNQTAVSQAIKAALLKDSSVDGLATVGGSDGPAGLDALSGASAGKVKYVHFNVDSTILAAVKSGKALGAIDQQPYAQGFYTVSAAFQLAQWGVELPTKPILTGPLVVDKNNVDAAVAGAKAGVR
jgi:simple sugar transport system substrate-binding protein